MKSLLSLPLIGFLLVLWSHPVPSQDIWVNEFHYDNTGADSGRFVELGHTVSLNGAILILRGDGIFVGTILDATLPSIASIDLTGLLPSSTVDGISYTVVDYPLPNTPAGFTLSYTNSLFTTLSYEGPLVARMETSIDVGVFEDETTPIGYSLQKCADTNDWIGPLPSTKGGPNKKCINTPASSPTTPPVVALAPVLPIPAQNIWVNEFHYDNTGADSGEFVELGHTISLNGARLFLMGVPVPASGTIPGDGTIPSTASIALSGLIPNSTVNGISYTVVDVPKLSNGPAGFLLSFTESVYFTLSYEGPLVAGGETSIDVGVNESDATPKGYSLQRCPDTNQWAGPLPNTRGGPNGNCTKPIPTSQPSLEPSGRPSNRPRSAPIPVAVPTPCGLFGLGIFCPLTRCGWIGRLLRLCRSA